MKGALTYKLWYDMFYFYVGSKAIMSGLPDSYRYQEAVHAGCLDRCARHTVRCVNNNYGHTGRLDGCFSDARVHRNWRGPCT